MSRVGKPFLKWAGGKRQLLPELRQVIFDVLRWHGTGSYREPFIGGGALFFDLQPTLPCRAVLSDSNERLVAAYRGVREFPINVATVLSGCRNDPEFFARWREREPTDDVDAAAWMIYLNRTCFNGLYRVNKKNKFNVPFGRYKNPKICDEENLRACSLALHGATISHCDFAEAPTVQEGSFVYFDPPYVPVSKTGDFTSYTRDGFTKEDQIRLRDHALGLKRRGVKVLLSNSSADLVRELYGGDWQIREVYARRNVNSDGDKRGAVKELLIW